MQASSSAVQLFSIATASKAGTHAESPKPGVRNTAVFPTHRIRLLSMGSRFRGNDVPGLKFQHPALILSD